MKANEAPEKIYLTSDEKNSYVFTQKRSDGKGIEYIRKDALVKYLYEEKGYPITLNGELVHWDELNEHLVEYINLKKQALIEKAYEWLKKNATYVHPRKSKEECVVNLTQFIDYMKGG